MDTKAPPILLSGFLITLSGAILLSTKAIFVKLAYRESGIDAIGLLALRMLFSLPFYLLIAWLSYRKYRTRLSLNQWFFIAGLGLLGYYLSSYFDFVGLRYISAGLERLILFIYPTLVVLINFFIYKQRVTPLQILALVLTYAGILLAFLSELYTTQEQTNIWTGSFFVVLCAISFSVYIVGSGRQMQKVPSGMFTAYAMLSATVGVLLHFAMQPNHKLFPLTPALWQYAIGLALVATVIPSFMISYGMKKVGANTTAIILAIGPVSTILQAYLFLGEKISGLQIFGTVLVVGGVLMVGWRQEPA
jgi:drug/metabolite transporter (DMT)-like permease